MTNKLYISNHYGDGDNPIKIIYYRAEWLNADQTHQILIQTPKANDYSIDDTVIYVPEEVNVVSEDELVDYIFNGAE